MHINLTRPRGQADLIRRETTFTALLARFWQVPGQKKEKGNKKFLLNEQKFKTKRKAFSVEILQLILPYIESNPSS